MKALKKLIIIIALINLAITVLNIADGIYQGRFHDQYQ